jgi:hypothetical protein
LRIHLTPLPSFSAADITDFVDSVVATSLILSPSALSVGHRRRVPPRICLAGATVISDGLASYRSLKGYFHQPKILGSMAAHIVLPWIHRVFANFKTWTLGTYHGVRRQHLRRYLEEFVYRWNRRRHMNSSFDTLIGIAASLRHAAYREFVNQNV